MKQEPMDDPDDLSLVARIKEGDFASFEVLVNRYQDKVFGLALSMVKDDAAANDVVQETFLNVFRKIDSFRGESAFSSWLYRITANNAMMKLRKRRRESKVTIEEGMPTFDGAGHFVVPIEDWTRRVDRILENRELGDQIREAVAKLPEKYRIVFMLSDIEELSMKEVGEILNLSIPNVKTRLHRARIFLRQELSNYLSSRG